MHKIDISILITTYNRAKYLKHLLQNIKNGVGELDFKYEILISNNGSKDDTSNVVDLFRQYIHLDYFVGLLP